MIKLSVVTTYRKRIKNFIQYAKHVKECKRPDVEFVLVSLGDDDERVKSICDASGIKYHYENHIGMFSNGKGHNIAAELACGRWMMKLDIDCIPYIGFFDRLIKYIDSNLKKKTDFLNIGCYFMHYSYELDNGLLTYQKFLQIQPRDIKQYNGRTIGGMLYVMNRQHYIDIGGTPDDFIGFGWEDYFVIYVLQKMKDPNFKLSSIPEDGLHVVIREEIARVVQKKTNDKKLITVHLHHDKDLNNAFYQKQKDNRSVLYNKVVGYGNNSNNNN